MDRYYIIGALLLGSAGTAGAVVVDALVSRSCSDTGEALFDCASEFRNEIKRGEKKKRGGGMSAFDRRTGRVSAHSLSGERQVPSGP